MPKCSIHDQKVANFEDSIEIQKYGLSAPVVMSAQKFVPGYCPSLAWLSRKIKYRHVGGMARLGETSQNLQLLALDLAL